MAKKYLSLEGLVEYDSLLKASYQEALNQISSGATVVGKAQEATHAESATTANSATEATHAVSADTATRAVNADSATKATQDGNGNVISETYETKTDAVAKLEEAKDYTDTKVEPKADKTNILVLEDTHLVENLTLAVGTPYNLSPAIELVEKEIWHCDSLMTVDGVEYHDVGLGRVLKDADENLYISFLNNTYALNNTTLTNNGKAEGTVTITKVLNYGKTTNYLIDQTEGTLGVSAGKYSHAEGHTTTANGSCSHAEGQETVANGNWSHVEGYNTITSASCSHAEGKQNTASGQASHVEGYKNTASALASHAEGSSTQAKGNYSHAEGFGTIAEGEDTHAEGNSTQAIGNYSHAEGIQTIANGVGSHAEGLGTIAQGIYQHVSGLYNIPSDDLSVIVGNGTDDENRINIHSLDWLGNAWFYGDVYVGTSGGYNKDEGSKKLVAEDRADEIAMIRVSAHGVNKTTHSDIRNAISEHTNNTNNPHGVTAAQIGALPDTTIIPDKVSQLDNDAGYLTSYTETDPTVPGWAKMPQKPSYTAAEVNADAAGSANQALTDAKSYTNQQVNTVTSNYTAADTALKSELSTTIGSNYTELKLWATQEAQRIKSELLNGADVDHDTLMELAQLIEGNAATIQTLREIGASKAEVTLKYWTSADV